MAFRYYVTDMLYYQAQGETLTYRYIDLITGKLDDEEITKDNDEEEITKDNVDDFILSFIDRAGLEVTE